MLGSVQPQVSLSNMIEETIEKVMNEYSIRSEIIIKQFKMPNTIPDKHHGVYIISEDDKVIYVGKGQIRRRQKKHWQKAFALLKNGTNDTKGWTWLRENYSEYNLTPENWVVRYIILNKETELSLMEGVLIHLLQPLANDETFVDYNRNLKG